MTTDIERATPDTVPRENTIRSSDNHREKAIQQDLSTIWPMFRVMNYITFVGVFSVGIALFMVDIYVDAVGGLAPLTTFGHAQEYSFRMSVSFYRLIMFIGHLLIAVFVVNRMFFMSWEFLLRRIRYPVARATTD